MLEAEYKYLPHGKSVENKNRPIIVVNTNERIKYYRHNIEINDNEGFPVKQRESLELLKIVLSYQKL